MSYYIRTKRIAAGCMIGVAMLVALNLAVQYAKRILGYESLLGLVRLFTLNQETNLPTWFSALLLLTAALLLLLVAVLKQARAARFTRHWFGLAFIFFLPGDRRGCGNPRAL